MRFQWALRDFAPSMLYISLQVVLAPYRHPRARVTHRLLFPIIVVPHRPCVLYLSTYLPSTFYFLLCRPSSLRFTPDTLTFSLICHLSYHYDLHPTFVLPKSRARSRPYKGVVFLSSFVLSCMFAM